MTKYKPYRVTFNHTTVFALDPSQNLADQVATFMNGRESKEYLIAELTEDVEIEPVCRNDVDALGWSIDAIPFGKPSLTLRQLFSKKPEKKTTVIDGVEYELVPIKK
jgi:hypothetical protein